MRMWTTDKLSFRTCVVSSLVVAAVVGGGAVRARAASESTEMSTEEGAKTPGIRNPVQYPGQLSSLYRINNDDPESGVPDVKQRNANPVEFGYYLQDLAAKAEAAEKQHDQRARIRFLRALAMATSEQAKGWSMLCEAYENAHERQHAIGACKYAIDREGVELPDFERFVRVVVAKEGELDNDERTALNDVLTHLDKDPSLALPTAHMRCAVAVKVKDQTAMEGCTAVLKKVAPNDPKTIVFLWSLAMMRGQRDDARNLLERAKLAGLATDSVARMTDLMAHTRWSSSRLVGAGALALAAAVALFLLLRRRMETRRFAASPPLPPA